MATIVQRYVNPASASGGDGTTNATAGANRAFSSISEAASNIVSNLVSADQQWDIECATTGGVADTTQVLSLAVGSFTTDATRYIRFYAASGHQALVTGWDTNRYRLSVNADLGILFGLGVPDIRFEGLQFECTSDSGDGEIARIGGNTYGATFGVQFIKCRFRGAAAQTNPREAFRAVGWAGKLVFANNVFENFASTVQVVTPGTGGVLVFYNNTGAGVAGGTGFDYFGSGQAATEVLAMKNNIFFGYDAGLSIVAGGATLELANNLTSDGTADDYGGSGHVTSGDPAFVGSGNYSIQSSGGADDAGTNLSGDARFAFAVDIAGTARPQGSAWDIGAHELAGGGGGGGVNKAFHRSMRRFLSGL